MPAAKFDITIDQGSDFELSIQVYEDGTMSMHSTTLPAILVGRTGKRWVYKALLICVLA